LKILEISDFSFFCANLLLLLHPRWRCLQISKSGPLIKNTEE
jgi:hypothetical protein